MTAAHQGATGLDTVESRASGGRVLLVEDDADLRWLLAEEIGEQGLDVDAVATAEDAMERMVEEPFDLLVTDLRLPGANGLDLLERSRALPDPPAALLITAFGTVDQAVTALKEGADDFLTKPLDLDQFGVRVARILDHRRLRHEVARYRRALRGDDMHGMVGRSPVMRDLFHQIAQVSAGRGPVLIQGESGVGKELVARAIHAESDRAEGAFRAINCAGVPEALLESEFFGHEAGAFTGASGRRKGLFRAAHGGTILLDEIGEMPISLQAKLLRALQDGTIRPIGSDRERTVDVRILASTNADLTAAVEADEFREDLFFRLNTFRLRVPPLREREGDIDLLAVHFIRRHAARLGRDTPEVAPAVFRRLRAHPFPGNVRELENTVERAVTFCESLVMDERHLPEEFHRGRDPTNGLSSCPTCRAREVPAKATRSEPPDGIWSDPPVGEDGLPTLREVGDWYLERVLDQMGGNKRRAAMALGVSRRTLYRRLASSDGEPEQS